MKVNPIQMQKSLKGVNYPASKDALIGRAKDNGADQKIMQALGGLPDQEFKRPSDVAKAISDIKE